MNATLKKTLSILLSVTLFLTMVLQNTKEAAANEGDAGGGLTSDPVPAVNSESRSGGPPQASGFDAMPKFGQVTASGSFQYRIPIDLPPGTGGMQPELALVYDSNIRDGLFGHGWTLSGIDMIARDPTYPIRFNDNDHYLFNGQRLIRKPDGTYRTQRDLNWIFELIHPNSESSYWQVSKPDGTKMYLGYNSSYHQGPASDGHIDAAGKDGKALLWSKSMERDARGNAYIIQYVEQGAPYHDYYPSSIAYTVGNGLQAHKTVTFEAEGREDTYAKYVPTKLEVSKRIKRILVKVNGQLLHAYHLTYNYGGQRPMSLLTSLQKFGSDHATALPPYTFTYDTGSASATTLTPGSPEFMDPYQYFLRTFTDSAIGGQKIISGDFNGDGRLDFMKQAFGGWENYSHKFQIYFATGQTATDGTYHIVTPSYDFQQKLSDSKGANLIPGDYNGDGLTDFIRQEKNDWGKDNVQTFQIYYATEYTETDGTFRIVSPTGDEYQKDLRYDPGANIIPGDYNGDGLTDFIRQERGGWSSDRIHTFNVYFATEHTETDGTFHIVTPTNGGWYQHLLRAQWVNLIPGDFNGDGKTDFLRQTKGDYDNKYYQNFEVFISNGNGTFKIKQPGSEQKGDAYQDYLRYDPGAILIPGDYNGDGKTDFIRQEYNGWDDNDKRTFQVFFATDRTEVDGTFHIVTPSGDQYLKDLKGDGGAFLYPGDFNGDGLTDFARQEHSKWDNDLKHNFDIYLSRGTGEFERIPLFPNSEFMSADGAKNDGGTHLFLTDVDGDGKTDILRQEKDEWNLSDYNNTFNVITTDFASPRLNRVTTELGASATLSYTPLADVEGAIVPGKDGDMIANNMGRQVVTSVEYEDGLGESYRYRYQYHDGRIKPGAVKETVDLGFRRTREIAPNGSIAEVHYLQDSVYYGLVDRTVNYVARKDTGDLVKVLEVKHHWDRQSSDGIDQILVTGKTTTTYDMTTGQAVDEVKEFYQHDPYGNVTKFKSSGRASLADDDYAVDIAYLYNATDYLVSFPHTMTHTGYTPDGAEQVLNKTKFLYDGQADDAAPVRGNVTEIRKWDGSDWVTTETNTYDVYGNVVSTTDANGHRAITAYDPVYHDLPISVTNALHQTESTTYDQLRRPVVTTDRNGLQTGFSYDAFSRIRAQSALTDGQLLKTTTYSLTDSIAAAGEYYNNQAMTGMPALVRSDSEIDFRWAHGSPSSKIGSDRFSVRWTGVIVPKYSESYTFYMTSDDGSRLFVDGQLLINRWVNQIPTERSAAIHLEAGRAYTVTMEYYENTGNATAKLEWSSDSQPREVVKFDVLPNQIQTVYNDDDQSREVQYMDGFGRVVQAKTQTGANEYQTVDTYYRVDAAVHRVTKRTSVPYVTNTSAFTARDESRPMAIEEAFADDRGGVMRLTRPDGQSATVIQNGFQVQTMNYGSDYVNKVSYYDSMNHVIRVEHYDLASAVIQETPYSWKQYTYYSGTDRLGKITDQDGNITSAQYDLLGRQTRYQDSDRGDWTYAYDPGGNLVRATDAKGQTVRLNYDAYHRVTLVDYPTGADIVFIYDESLEGSYNVGFLTTVIYGSGQDRFQYDARGRLKQFQRTLDGKTRALQYTYDRMGRSQTVTYPDGETVTNTYDYQNLSAISGTSSYIDSIQYTDYGWVSQIRYGNGTSVNMDYADNAAEGLTYQLKSLSVSGGDVDLHYQYGYDSATRLTSIDDLSGYDEDKTLIYDPMNRLIQASYPDGALDEYSYNEMDNMTRKNDLTLRYQGKQPHAVTKVAADSVTSDVYPSVTNDVYSSVTSSVYHASDFAYTYDPNGNMTSRIPLTGDGVAGAQGEYFDNPTLSGVPLLTRADAAIDLNWSLESPEPAIAADRFSVRWTGIFVPEYSETYTIYTTADGGVRLWVNGQPLIDDWNDHSAERSAAIALTAGQAYAVQLEYYDHTGPASAKLEWDSPLQEREVVPLYRDVGAGIRTFSYDYGNHLTQASDNGDAIFSAAYDYTGQRVKKTEGGVTTYYFFPQYTEVYDGSTLTETNKFYYRDNLAPFAWRQNGSLYYLYTDHLGSVIRVADSSGHLVGKASYHPYGEPGQVEGLMPEMRFTGQIYDSSTGLYYYNARYYDPGLAQFITVDSIIPGGDTNGYGYATRSPQMYADPSGHFIVALIIGVSLTMIAVGVGLYVGGTLTDNKNLQIAGLVCIGVGLVLFSLALPAVLPAAGFFSETSLGGALITQSIMNQGFGMIGNAVLGATGVDPHALKWKRVLIDSGFNIVEGVVFGTMFHPTVLTRLFAKQLKRFPALERWIFKRVEPETDVYVTIKYSDGIEDVITGAIVKNEIEGMRFVPQFLLLNAVESPLLSARIGLAHQAGVHDLNFKEGALLALQPFNVFVRVGVPAVIGKFISQRIGPITGDLVNRTIEATTRSWAIPPFIPTLGF